jgi:hypothetical protein
MMIDMTKSQLELTFESRNRSIRTIPRQRSLRSAHWWFDQMRQVVDRALERRPASAPRPEQIYLSLSSARASV